MGRRKAPYLTKTKTEKNCGRDGPPTETDYTSRDIFYTTESNDVDTSYNYTNKYINYKDYFTSDVYESRLFDTYGSKRKGSGEPYTFDDYITSGISDSNLKKRPKNLIYSVSSTDHKYRSPEKYSNISYFRDYDHSYPKGSKAREKKRPRLMKESERLNYYDVQEESEQYLNKDRRYRSPRSRYYQDLIHEEPEKEFDYDKYFEKAGPKAGSSPKQKKKYKYDESMDEKQNKFQSRVLNKHNDYQVYAYQNPKHHEEIFKGKSPPGDLSLSSEVEVKTHEYPVLAFRDTNSGNKETDNNMVYLPIIVLDKKSGKPGLKKSPKEPVYRDNVQVFAANLQEQPNIFEQLGDLPTITSKEPTGREKEHTQFGIEATSGMRYANSLLGTVIDDAVGTDYRYVFDQMNETGEDQRIPFKTGKSPFTYQVNVDILPNEPTVSLKDIDKKSFHVKNSSINDNFHDGYPVTKDYIKVSVSEQNRKSKEESKLQSVMGQKTTEEKKSNAIPEGAQKPSSIKKLTNDQTISTSIAHSKASPATKSIMRNLSQEQPLTKELGSTGQSVAAGTKENSRASHTGPAVVLDARGKPKTTKLSVLNEETSQESRQKSTKPGTSARQSPVRSRPSKVGSGMTESTAGSETRHGSFRKSMKPNMHTEQSSGRESKVQTTPFTPSSPVSGHQNAVSHSQVGQIRNSTVAHMTEPHCPTWQNMRTSHAQSISAVAPRSSAANNDDPKSLIGLSVLERSQKAVPESTGKKSLVQSLTHNNTHTMAENVDKLPDVKEDKDSTEALRQFTKAIFQVDLGSQGRSPSHQSDHNKPSVSAALPNHGTESKSAVGQQPLNATGQTQNLVRSVEPSHEQIGDNSAGICKAPTVEEGKRNPSGLMRTKSKLFITLSKLGQKKSTEQDQPHISTGSPTGSRKAEEKAKSHTQDNDDSHLVRSIKPTITQYKKEQNKTNTLTKSNSKPDTKVPKENKFLTRVFSRSKSNLGNESGDENKKIPKSKSRSLLGILRRSKSSELMVTSPAEGGEEVEGRENQPAECECLTHYVQNARVCAYFFLGTTLHEQIMNIMKLFLGGN